MPLLHAKLVLKKVQIFYIYFYRRPVLHGRYHEVMTCILSTLVASDRRMTGEYVYFAIVMFIALMIILIVWVNYQWGASFFTFLMIILMLIYCIIGTVLLLLAVVGHDE